MNPILYEATEKQFNTLGIGTLTDCISCLVTEERNGLYELEMEYPTSGVHYAELRYDRIILAKANENHQAQPFRIYKLTKPIGGVIAVYAAHISYDTADIPVSPFTASNAPDAVAKFVANSDIANPFTFSTDKSTATNFTAAVPFNFRERLFGVQGSLLDVYGGGDFEFDRWNIYFRASRGADNGVAIEYGKNLTDAQQEENIASLITGVRPYWYSEEEGRVELPEKVLLRQHNLSHDKVEVLDLSSEFEEKPTVEDLRKAATSYLESTTKTAPTVSISVSFVPLWQTENYKSHPLYKQIAGLERVSLCDTVTVRYPDIGIDTTAKVVKTVYDSLRERFETVEIGEPKTGLSTIVADQQKELEQAVDESFIAQAILAATNAITGYSGGYIVFDPPKNPQRILIMDTPDKGTAQRVWQWNLNGLGYSSTGINGPYRLAMTTNPGAIVADFITAGTLNAALAKVINLDASNINAGTLNGNVVNVTNLNASNINAGTLNGRDVNIINLNANNIASGSLSADRITSGTINADLIKAGTIQDAAGKNKINMVSGEVSMQGSFLAAGQHMGPNSSTDSLTAEISGGEFILKTNGNETIRLTTQWSNSGSTAPDIQNGGIKLSDGRNSSSVDTRLSYRGIAVYSGNTPVGSLYANDSGNAYLTITHLNGRNVNWRRVTIDGSSFFVLASD